MLLGDHTLSHWDMAWLTQRQTHLQSCSSTNNCGLALLIRLRSHRISCHPDRGSPAERPCTNLQVACKTVRRTSSPASGLNTPCSERTESSIVPSPSLKDRDRFCNLTAGFEHAALASHASLMRHVPIIRVHCRPGKLLELNMRYQCSIS